MKIAFINFVSIYINIPDFKNFISKIPVQLCFGNRFDQLGRINFFKKKVTDLKEICKLEEDCFESFIKNFFTDIKDIIDDPINNINNDISEEEYFNKISIMLTDFLEKNDMKFNTQSKFHVYKIVGNNIKIKKMTEADVIYRDHFKLEYEKTDSSNYNDPDYYQKYNYIYYLGNSNKDYIFNINYILKTEYKKKLYFSIYSALKKIFIKEGKSNFNLNEYFIDCCYILQNNNYFIKDEFNEDILNLCSKAFFLLLNKNGNDKKINEIIIKQNENLDSEFYIKKLESGYEIYIKKFLNIVSLYKEENVILNIKNENDVKEMLKFFIEK